MTAVMDLYGLPGSTRQVTCFNALEKLLGLCVMSRVVFEEINEDYGVQPKPAALAQLFRS